MADKILSALEEVWDDGNASGLDGWVGPGRGGHDPVDDQAVFQRDRVIRKVLAELDGWRPPARVIRTAEELDALPDGVIIRSFWGVVGQKEDEAWVFSNMIGRHLGTGFDLPATVLWQPEVND